MNDRRAFKIKRNIEEFQPSQKEIKKFEKKLNKNKKRNKYKINSNKYHLSHHALIRLQERDIDLNWLLWCLYTDKAILSKNADTEERVVYHKETGEFLLIILEKMEIITVMPATHRIKTIPEDILDLAYKAQNENVKEIVEENKLGVEVVNSSRNYNVCARLDDSKVKLLTKFNGQNPDEFLKSEEFKLFISDYFKQNKFYENIFLVRKDKYWNVNIDFSNDFNKD